MRRRNVRYPEPERPIRLTAVVPVEGPVRKPLERLELMAAQILARHSALAALPELSEDLGLCLGQKVAEVQSTLPARPEDSNEVAVAENDFPERRPQLREVVVNEQQRKAEAPCSRERCFEPATQRRSVKQMEELV